MTNPNKEKKLTVLLAVVVILLLVMTGLLTYVLIDAKIIPTTSKEDKNIETNINKNSKEENISLDDSNFYPIYEKLKSYTYQDERKEGYKSFTDKELATISLKEFTENDFEELKELDSYGSHYYRFKASDLVNKLKKYFGQDIKFTDYNNLVTHSVATNVNFNGSGLTIKEFDPSSETFKCLFGGIGGTTGPTPQITNRKITKATKQDDEITVVEKAIYYTSTGYSDEEYYSIYSNPTKTRLIDSKIYKLDTITNEVLSVESYIEQATTITHTFKKNKTDNNYHFEKTIIDIN